MVPSDVLIVGGLAAAAQVVVGVLAYLGLRRGQRRGGRDAESRLIEIHNLVNGNMKEVKDDLRAQTKLVKELTATVARMEGDAAVAKATAKKTRTTKR